LSGQSHVTQPFISIESAGGVKKRNADQKAKNQQQYSCFTAPFFPPLQQHVFCNSHGAQKRWSHCNGATLGCEASRTARLIVQNYAVAIAKKSARFTVRFPAL
jgi:hypothetical protein